MLSLVALLSIALFGSIAGFRLQWYVVYSSTCSLDGDGIFALQTTACVVDDIIDVTEKNWSVSIYCLEVPYIEKSHLTGRYVGNSTGTTFKIINSSVDKEKIKLI